MIMTRWLTCLVFPGERHSSRELEEEVGRIGVEVIMRRFRLRLHASVKRKADTDCVKTCSKLLGGTAGLLACLAEHCVCRHVVELISWMPITMSNQTYFTIIM